MKYWIRRHRVKKIAKWASKDQRLYLYFKQDMCDHKFETIEVEKELNNTYMWFSYGEPAKDKVKFCNKCGMKVEL